MRAEFTASHLSIEKVRSRLGKSLLSLIDRDLNKQYAGFFYKDKNPAYLILCINF